MMGNYKPRFFISFDMSGVSVPIVLGRDKIITLSKTLTASSYTTLENPDGTDYQVPVGKTAYVIDSGRVGILNTNTNEGIYSTTAADANTGAVALIVDPWNPKENSPVFLKVTTGLFITAFDTSAALYTCTIWETDQ